MAGESFALFCVVGIAGEMIGIKPRKCSEVVPQGVQPHDVYGQATGMQVRPGDEIEGIEPSRSCSCSVDCASFCRIDMLSSTRTQSVPLE